MPATALPDGPLTRPDVEELSGARTLPSVSIYMPTHRAGSPTRQDPIVLGNLLTEAERELEALDVPVRDARRLLAPVRARVDDDEWWRHQRDGLAIFLADGYERLWRLPRRFETLCVVGGAFHVTPLVPLVTRDARFGVLAISQNHVRLLDATRHEVARVDLDGVPATLEAALGHAGEAQLQFHTSTAPRPHGERRAMYHGHGAGGPDETDVEVFLRLVDDALYERFARRDVPLVLAGVERVVSAYRRISRLPVVADGAILGNPEHLGDAALRDEAWAIVARSVDEERKRALLAIGDAQGQGRGSHDPHEVLAAALEGRVDTLVVALRAHRWAHVEPSGAATVHEAREPGDIDLLDAAVRAALLTGAAIHTLDAAHVRDASPIAASFRYRSAP